jgi:hypothetical protein
MKRFTMHVPRARDSCTSYATENTDYVTVVGSSKKFSDGEISKTTTVGPLQFNYAILLPRAPVRSNMDT